MNKLDNITLLIPTHERHNYLNRILEYYKQDEIKIIIADSSPAKYDETKLNPSIKYYHYPAIGLPQKLSMAFKLIETEYVVMCSDDDFIIPAGINSCIEFLECNKAFSAAQGNCIAYKKEKKYADYIEMNVMYKDQLAYEISNGNPYDRLALFFNSYRTIFSAVHYTKNLQLAFENVNNKFSNLFLNEYLTAIIPIVKGKYKELPILYQVREYAEDSGDKSTDNLDIMYADTKYENELKNYVEYVSDIIFRFTFNELEERKSVINDVFRPFGKRLAQQKILAKYISFSKQIGNTISLIPVIGKKIVMKYRLYYQRKNLNAVIRTKEDKLHLEKIKKLIFKYGES